MTAHRALTVAEDGPSRLSPGALDGVTVLVSGGAGAVGHAAIQLARWAGATVVTTISNDEKAALARAAGAHHVVNYREQDAAAEIRRIAPDGVQIVVEVNVGANAELLSQVVATRASVAIYANDGGDRTSPRRCARTWAPTRGTSSCCSTPSARRRCRRPPRTSPPRSRDGALPVGEEAGLPLHRFTLEQTAAAHEAVERRGHGQGADRRLAGLTGLRRPARAGSPPGPHASAIASGPRHH